MKPSFPSMTLFSLCLIGSLIHLQSAFAANEVLNQEALRQKFGLQAYATHATDLENLKIAVLDNGFAGFESGTLPKSAELIEGPVTPWQPTPHGMGMAEIIWAMTGRHPEGPHFYLVNANGFSNFKAAVQFAVDHKVDLILYSQVWPFGDNFDGAGFINAAVNQAAKAGILWINAAGNNGSSVYNGSILSQTKPSTDLIQFKDSDHLRFENKLDENEVTITLSWTDFTETEDYNATKDLDLFVYDSSGTLMGSSEWVQSGIAPPRTGTSKLSSYARESVPLRGLNRGTYWIRVKAKSKNFAQSDRFRILVTSTKTQGVEFTDHSSGAEIMPPADNPNVITVGEGKSVSSVGPTADGRAKPDVIIDDSTTVFSNGTQTDGSSTAAALVAGSIAVMKMQEPSLTFTQLSNYMKSLKGATTLLDLSPISPTLVNPWVFNLIPHGGGVMIHNNGHLVVLTPGDPIQLPVFVNAGAYRYRLDDILTVSPVNNAWYGFPLGSAFQIVAPLIEFRQIPQAYGVWIAPPPEMLRRL